MIASDLVALFDPSKWLFEAILERSRDTVGAYPLDMLKTQESSATAGKQGPAAVGGGRGETLSKQVYLGRL